MFAIIPKILLPHRMVRISNQVLMWGCVRSRSWNHISVLVFSMASSLLSVFTNWATMDLFWPTTVWIYNSTASSFHQKKGKVAQSDSFQPHGLWPNRLLCPWKSPGKNTVVDCHSLLQGIFPIHRSNLGLPHSRRILLPSEPRCPPYLESVILKPVPLKCQSSEDKC